MENIMITVGDWASVVGSVVFVGFLSILLVMSVDLLAMLLIESSVKIGGFGWKMVGIFLGLILGYLSVAGILNWYSGNLGKSFLILIGVGTIVTPLLITGKLLLHLAKQSNWL